MQRRLLHFKMQLMQLRKQSQKKACQKYFQAYISQLHVNIAMKSKRPSSEGFGWSWGILLQRKVLRIDLVTVFDAILTSRQTFEKLQCLYENLMLNSLQIIFFSEQPFYGNYSTLDSHTITVISQAFAYSSRWRWKPSQGLFYKYDVKLSIRSSNSSPEDSLKFHPSLCPPPPFPGTLPSVGRWGEEMDDISD